MDEDYLLEQGQLASGCITKGKDSSFTSDIILMKSQYLWLLNKTAYDWPLQPALRTP